MFPVLRDQRPCVWLHQGCLRSSEMGAPFPGAGDISGCPGESPFCLQRVKASAKSCARVLGGVSRVWNEQQCTPHTDLCDRHVSTISDYNQEVHFGRGIKHCHQPLHKLDTSWVEQSYCKLSWCGKEKGLPFARCSEVLNFCCTIRQKTIGNTYTYTHTYFLESTQNSKS